MASLSIRKLDDKIYRQLGLRAKKHGISMEEEARQILLRTLSAPENISEVFKKYFGPENGIDLDTTDLHLPHGPIEL